MKATTRHWRTIPGHVAGHVTLLAALAACQALPVKAPYEYATDMGRRPWPAECRRDLSHLATPVVRVPKEALPPRVLGLWLGAGERRILIADDLTGELLDDTIHHERCHEAMFLATGDSRWHP